MRNEKFWGAALQRDAMVAGIYSRIARLKPCS